MCTECGCALTPDKTATPAAHSSGEEHGAGERSIAIMHGLLRENDHQAAHNREHLRRHGVLAVNLMSSPGSGKTSLLEATIDEIGDWCRIAVIEGDLETDNDARRIRAKGVPAVQITTGQACHLDARMVHEALHALDLSAIDILFIENVGNLVCPASFDLGQEANVVLLAVTEGDDKPAKYPVMFRAADLILLSKSDLLGVIDDFSPARAREHVRALANAGDILAISARRADTLQPWIAWLKRGLAEMQGESASYQGQRAAAHGHFAA